MKVIDRRVGWLFLGFVLLLGLALARAFWLGGVQSEHLTQAAFAEQVRSEPVPADRGEITDATGVPLAISEPVQDIVADPYIIAEDHDAQAMAAKIAPLVKLPELTVVEALTRSGTGYSPIALQVAPSVATAVTNLTIGGKPINGIYTEADTKRVYPRAWDLSQVLGFVNHTGEGAAGLESYYNTQLAGRTGERRVIDNPHTGKPLSIQTVRRMTGGESLRLTISAPLQDEVEQVLAGVGAEYQPKFATAIVMNPNTGALLALGNWPRVNANDPYAGAPTSVINNAIQDHAVSFTYEPGSTFKAVTVSGALQDGLITPSTEFNVPSVLQTPYGTVIHDAEPHPDEELSTAQILKVSSNIGADEIGAKLGPYRFNDWVHRFGLGRATGVDLPGEDDGSILPTSQYSGTSMDTLPFGQGEAVTPLQMATVYSAIANGGVLRAPHVVSAVGGRAVAEPAGHRIISATTAAEVRNMLRGVLADGGTASGAAIPGYDMAGKTGTAQVAVDGRYSKTDFVASFIGMVPANAPKLVVAVVVDQPQGDIYGGAVAGPAFQKIVGFAVPFFGINPNPEHVRTATP